MKQCIVPFLIACLTSLVSAQTSESPPVESDSMKMAALFAISEYPLLKGSGWSGVLPVENPTEVPDPAREYRLLFEIIEKNPDSLAGEINFSLDEVARIINLHVASGIPQSRIEPVIVVLGPGIELAAGNNGYMKRHAMGNPNIPLIRDMEEIGARFIVCGQAMAFFDMKRDELLPGTSVTLTTQTSLSEYQLQGYVLYAIKPDR